MDFLYEHERNFGGFEDPDSKDMMEQNIFATSSMEMSEDSFLPSLTDNDWFINSIFGDQDLVYNDKNLGETASQPCIKSEHSYSSNHLSPASPTTTTISSKPDETENTIFLPQSTTTTTLDSNQGSQVLQGPDVKRIKCESPMNDPLLPTIMTSDSSTSSTFTHAPTIILATTTSSTVPAYGHSTQTVFPTTTVHIKTDPGDTLESLQEQTVSMDTVVLPPTPPSSNGSDSDGSQSPQRSAPNSPQRQSPVRLYHCQPLRHASSSDIDTCLAGHTFSQPLFLSPMPQSGVLILSEEEKRTLISEGYPIPSKLPLTKQEEKNLKKVRRKIKNKISAQESRRKKKEYLEQLEKRVEAFNHENSDLKKKVESLENNNRSLLGQLHKLQAMLAKVPKSAAASATQTSTVLMVLVLCFAVFLGGSGMGLSSLNVGYGSAVPKPPLVFQQQPGPLRVQPNMGPGAPRAVHAADDYTTPNLKSRVLMAFSKEEPDDYCDEYRPMPWGREESCPTDRQAESPPVADLRSGPANPKVDDVLPIVDQPPVKEDSHQQSAAVVTIAMGAADSNATQDAKDEYQAMMHPDIAVAPSLGHGNFTADLETA